MQVYPAIQVVDPEYPIPPPKIAKLEQASNYAQLNIHCPQAPTWAMAVGAMAAVTKVRCFSPILNERVYGRNELRRVLK